MTRMMVAHDCCHFETRTNTEETGVNSKKEQDQDFWIKFSEMCVSEKSVYRQKTVAVVVCPT